MEEKIEIRLHNQTKEEVRKWWASLTPDPLYRYEVDFEPDKAGRNTASFAYDTTVQEYVLTRVSWEKYYSPLALKTAIQLAMVGGFDEYKIEFNDGVSSATTVDSPLDKLITKIMNPVAEFNLIRRALQRQQTIDVFYSQEEMYFTLEIRNYCHCTKAAMAWPWFESWLRDFADPKNNKVEQYVNPLVVVDKLPPKEEESEND